MKSIKKNSLIIERVTRGEIHDDYMVYANSSLTLVYIVTGEKDISLSPKVHLVGSGASATIIGLVSGSHKSNIHIDTLQHHKSPRTTSNLLVKSVLRDESTCFYTGSILVDKTAQKTDAYQRNENLLLDEHSRASSSPALEILANDVRCTHGAVVKTLDDNEMWYLESRGIDRRNARDMIAAGFLASALTLVHDDKERHLVQQKLLL